MAKNQMKNKISKIKLFSQKKDEATKETRNNLIRLLRLYDFHICTEKERTFDLGITIGGDGSFIDMVKKTNFNQKSAFIGVNTGTLGFMQNVPNDLDSLIEFISILQSETYEIKKHCILNCKVIGNENVEIDAVNEIIFKRPQSKLAMFNIYLDGHIIETFHGDGILICSSLGSTAQNLSYHGSIVYGVETLQITPMGALNSHVYHTLPNSIIIPTTSTIKIETICSEDPRINLVHDGSTSKFENVSFEISAQKGIKKLNAFDTSLAETINEKLL